MWPAAEYFHLADCLDDVCVDADAGGCDGSCSLQSACEWMAVLELRNLPQLAVCVSALQFAVVVVVRY